MNYFLKYKLLYKFLIGLANYTLQVTTKIFARLQALDISTKAFMDNSHIHKHTQISIEIHFQMCASVEK
jgi:hypothetical protein